LFIQTKVENVILKMSENKEEIRYILKILLQKGKNATQTAKKICDVYKHDAVSVRVAQIWFKRFQSGNFDVKVAPCSDPLGKSIKSYKKLNKTGTLVVMISVRN